MPFVTTGRTISLALKGLVIATALGLLAGCSEEKVVEAPEVIRPVKVVEVAAADNGRHMEYSGSVKARTEMNLGFRVSGKITERLVDVGERVKPGDLLARLDSVDYELAVRRAEADLSSARKQVETAELSYRRADQLFSKNVTSRSALEQATLVRDQAQSSEASAASALAQAQNQTAYTELKSDMSGIVTGVSADIGQVVGSGTTVVTIAVDGAKEVQIAVPEMDISQFRPGKVVSARFWSDTALVLDGKVREVAGSADLQSRTFAVRVTLSEDGRVLLGMTATISATEDEAVATYELPLGAIGKNGEQSVVWVVDRGTGKVSSRPVTVVDFSDDGVRISTGVARGDLVVAAGTQFMTEAMKVKIPEHLADASVTTDTLDTAAIKR